MHIFKFQNTYCLQSWITKLGIWSGLLTPLVNFGLIKLQAHRKQGKIRTRILVFSGNISRIINILCRKLVSFLIFWCFANDFKSCGCIRASALLLKLYLLIKYSHSTKMDSLCYNIYSLKNTNIKYLPNTKIWNILHMLLMKEK